MLLQAGETVDRDEVLRKLVDIQYARNDFEPARGKFRVRGDSIEILPAYEDTAIRIELFGDEVEQIERVDPVGGEVLERPRHVAIYPATHFVTSGPEPSSAPSARSSASSTSAAPGSRRRASCSRPSACGSARCYDMEMLREMGFCNGIENYSRILLGREPGATPNCLLDYFPDDFLVLHRRVAHVRCRRSAACTRATESRKKMLVDYGFRLPCALDNRPLRFDEFLDKVAADRLRHRHAGRVRARQQRQHRRADHPAHRPHRSRGRGAAAPRARSTTS